MIRNYLTILLFHHFPDKIEVKIKEKAFAPKIKNSEIKKIIQNFNFKFTGIRQESIFKIFSLKYFLYKNDKNNYLDITQNMKFYYISYYLNQKLYLLYKKHPQILENENDKIKISFIDGNEELPQSDDVGREEIASFYYKNNMSLLPLSLRIPLYLMAVIYVIQFFYIILKWVI